MPSFAKLNPDHIILLLTKRPEWYALVEWPENVWCGFSATNNKEYCERVGELDKTGAFVRKRAWISCEPWLDDEPPIPVPDETWLAIGGLSGPKSQPVSEATLNWLRDDSVQAKRFTKQNALFKSEYWEQGLDDVRIEECPREYPDGWRVPEVK